MSIYYVWWVIPVTCIIGTDFTEIINSLSITDRIIFLGDDVSDGVGSGLIAEFGPQDTLPGISPIFGDIVGNGTGIIVLSLSGVTIPFKMRLGIDTIVIVTADNCTTIGGYVDAMTPAAAKLKCLKRMPT